ncbi:MAG: hypothetical protein O6940_10410 [Ignavibacteria bacterium]|nr:hypothetical protein [Ignavibacteria bacterium]
MFKRFQLPGILFFTGLMNLISCGERTNDNYKPENYHYALDSSVSTTVDHLFFVGMYGGQSGVYKFEFSNNEYKIFWYSPKEAVVNLLYSDDLKNAFFLTVKKIGISKGVSFIRGIKLYRLDTELSEVELISELGDAVQILAQWVETNYNFQLTRFDLKIASYIKKIDQIFSPFGKLLNENVETFDFINDGYPQFDIQQVSLISPSGNFGITQVNDSIFLNIGSSGQNVYIDSTAETLRNIKWSYDENYVFFASGAENSGNISNTVHSIYVYNVADKKLVMKWSSKSRKNFILANDLLLFNDSFLNHPIIVLYNFLKEEEVGEIKIRGGCGLTGIPIN